jgi:imidazolonepropionase
VVPPEHTADSWVDEIIAELLPAVAKEGLATGCDVFVEAGAFSLVQAERLLLAARDCGLLLRVHAEQLSHTGAAALAARLQATSVSHLEHITAADAAALAAAGVVCEVLATAQVFLRGQRPIPGRMLADSGCALAIGTDFNPGTAWSRDLPLALGLAVSQAGLTVEEALWAATAGSARAIGLADRGRVAVGLAADLVVVDAETPAALCYRWGDAPIHAVVKGGVVVVEAT